jgi:hypothetical protein
MLLMTVRVALMCRLPHRKLRPLHCPIIAAIAPAKL